MSRVSAPTLRGAPLNAILRLWNPLMRRLLVRIELDRYHEADRRSGLDILRLREEV